MPLDFRTYTDPGVTIEEITPPVVFTAAIEPTILAIVGDAPSARVANESTTLSTVNPVVLDTLGGAPISMNIIDRILGTQYVNGGIAALDAVISAGSTSITVTTYYDALLPTLPFTAQIEDELVTVSAASLGSSQVWTIARGASSTTAVAHGVGQIINDATEYNTTDSLEVGTLTAPISTSATSFQVTAKYGVQTVTLTGYSGTDSFKLTYNGVETASIIRGTNYNLAGIATALEAHADITDVTVTSIADDSSLTDAGFIVRFLDPNTDVTALTVTSTSGCSGTVAARGVADNTYLDVEGERMLVTDVSGSAPQTVTVARGVRGTNAVIHGAVEVFENTGADYTLSIGAGEDAEFNTTDDTIAVRILDDARIVNGTYVNLMFDVTDEAQFDAGLFDDMDAVRDKYGDPLDANGNINSDLTLAAQLAFANGATQLVLISTDPDDSSPIQDAVDRLQFEQNVNVVVVLSGNSSDINYIRSHTMQMAQQGLLRRAFVGLDGLASPAPTSSSFVTKAQQLHDSRVSLVGPGQFKVENGTEASLVVPGYFAAAAVAGLHAGQNPQEPLTRKQVFGFTGIKDQGTNSEIFSMQANGTLVVFEDRFGRLIIKHGLTTDMSTVYTREVSVVAARDRLRDFIQETLEGGQLIGSAMTAQTPDLVMAAVNSALEEAMGQGLIFSYQDVKFRIPAESLTTIEVRFSYKPTLPLNNIHVEFSIDTTTATVEFQSINENEVA